ncbi:MAG: hypothetical protein WCB99_04160 [Candidatus Cybelea sp.]
MPNPTYSREQREALASAEKELADNLAAMDEIRVKLIGAEDDDADALRKDFDDRDFRTFVLRQRIDGIAARNVKGLHHKALDEEFAEINANITQAYGDQQGYIAVIKDAEGRMKAAEAAYAQATKDLARTKREAPGAFQVTARRARFIIEHPEYSNTESA